MKGSKLLNTLSPTQPSSHQPLMAYADRISVAPSETIRFMVSTENPEYRVEVFRLLHGDENPAGPGLKQIIVPTAVDGTYKGRVQQIRCGSYARVPDSRTLRLRGSLSLQAWVFPTTPGKGLQGILTKWCAVENSGYGLFLDEKGCLTLALGGRDGVTEWASSHKPLRASTWYFVAATWDAKDREIGLYQKPVARWPFDDSLAIVKSTVGFAELPENSVPVCLGACVDHVVPDMVFAGFFNGKLDSPALFSRSLSQAEIEELEQDAPPSNLGDALIAAWDFSREISTDQIVDISQNHHNGVLVNMPARAVTGHNWSGDTFTRYADVPQMYRAVHFHDDDLGDAGWQTDFEFTTPDDFQSAIYAVRLTSTGEDYFVPFIVKPKKGSRTAPIVFLAPSISWQSYINYHEMVSPFNLPSSKPTTWLKQDLILQAHPELGLSQYDRHSDGSPVYYSSRLRPNLSGDPRYKYAPSDSPHLLAADLYVVNWLTEKAYSFDVISDEDLHFQGGDILEPYRVLITGAHPEYWTGQMLDALQVFLDHGGRVMYLGGNGFYWITSLDRQRPVIEVRRSLGTRLSTALEGEHFHSTTGERGGIWRARGRAPQKMVGIGFSAQGGVPGSTYHRKPDSFNPRAAFIFEGVSSHEAIGNFGLCTGAAAGFEIDRMDHALGTPPNALLLASSSDHNKTYWHTIEEAFVMGEHECASKDVRADIVFYEHPAGGGVFAVGSIAWTGALSHNNYNNSVARISENVLKRFLSEERLA
jgi:N,N-dimethylformamidase